MNLFESRGTWLLLAALFVIACLTGCGQRDDSGPAPVTPSTTAQPETPAPPQNETPEPLPPGTEPLAAPLAYFGKIDLERSTLPVNVEPVPRASVILIVIDALNPRHLGTYGYHRNTSPTLDALARDSISFTNYVSNSSWTRPSYATIITGQPKSVHKTELNGKDLQDEITTLAERFRDAGYNTAGFIGNPLAAKVFGFAQGYQVYLDAKAHKQTFAPDPWLVDGALKWMASNPRDPFFVTIFLTAPHTPYAPPPESRHFLNEVPTGEVIKHPFREYATPLPAQDRDRIVAAYDDEISISDGQVARVLQFLKKKGISDRTVVAVVADHGEMFGAHGCFGHTYHMWEPAVRVPFILSTPTLSRRGIYDDRPFTHIDIAPTRLAAAGLTAEGDTWPGISILDALASPQEGRHRSVYTQYNAYGIRRQAIRQDGMKLVRYERVEDWSFESINGLNKSIERANPKELPSLVSQLAGERFELFNLSVDPQEERNLYSNRKSRQAATTLIHGLLSNYDLQEKRGSLSPELVEALRNAGYMVPGEAEKHP